jgi:hypothetical protein
LKRTFYILTILAVFAGILSCKKKKTIEEPPDSGQEYYPGTLGKYIVYDVDSIIYDEFLEEAYTDIQGRPALKLARYIKKFSAAVSYSAMPWTIKDVWQVNISATNIEVVEENVRLVKLIFPVKESAKWNGNIYNSMDEWEYTYTYIDKAQTLNSIPFGEVALVTQKNFPTLISREYYVEKYVKGLGLVYREIIDLDLDTVASTTLSIDAIREKKGVVYKSIVNSYGYE